MTKVFVHGNPETSAIWGPLTAELNARGVDDIVTLSPPGFGAPAPEGFAATPAAYVDWLAGELGSMEGPVDLLGHDWGAGHVLGLAASHPELIRSYAVDIAGILHPDYVWHDMAQVWRTPEAGEQAIEASTAMTDEEKAGLFVALGMPDDMAAEVGSHLNAEMGDCILKLYRGADPEVLADLCARLVAAEDRPSLILNAEDDAYVGADLSPEVAKRTGSQIVSLPGQGHWWMVQDPAPAAEALTNFWGLIDATA